MDTGGEVCDYGVLADGTVVGKVDAKVEDGEEPYQICADEEDAGGPITPPGAVLDIAALTYTNLTIELLAEADIKGCVSANFKDSSLNPGNHYLLYTISTPSNGTTSPSHDVFENVTASTVKVPLSKATIRL